MKEDLMEAKDLESKEKKIEETLQDEKKSRTGN